MRRLHSIVDNRVKKPTPNKNSSRPFSQFSTESGSRAVIISPERGDTPSSTDNDKENRGLYIYIVVL